ncbi:MAG: toast rack family protein [Candidatus Caldatribacteriota bacterium]|nr:toast rack family protein [Candidatus Caldatribacteriota bacterium]
MKANKIINGLTLLLIGIILLANTLNILEWSIWSNIIKLWPLFLVSWGISLIFRGKSLSFLGPLIIFLGIIAGVGASYMGISFEGEIVKEVKTLSREIVIEVEKVPEIETALETEITPETEAAPETEITPETEASLKTKEYPEIERASIELNLNVGKLTLGESTPLLYECISQYRYKEFEPFEKFSYTEKEANILIYHPPVIKRRISNNIRNHWQLKLNNEIIYNLSVETGAINTDCNLSDFKVEKLHIESGASNIKLVVPKYNSKIIIDTGASNIDIAIPKNVGTTVNIDSGIAIKDLDDFIKKDSMYISNNYNSSEFKVDIEIDCGVSHINIHYTDIP